METQDQAIEVKRTYLQMTDPAELNSAKIADEHVQVVRAAACPVSFFRYLYTEVGRKYHWVDRLGWTDDEARDYLAQPCVSLWVMYYDGSPAGYFELKQHDDGSTEIAYFGLLQEFIGRGLGKHLLTCAVEQAWATGARRIWLHTCTLDDQAALPNYIKRGFRPFKEERYLAHLSS